MNHEIRGWNECLIAYVLAASAPRYPIEPDVYHRGWAVGRDFLNGRSYYDIELPLGPDHGGRCSSPTIPSWVSTRAASRTATPTTGNRTSRTR